MCDDLEDWELEDFTFPNTVIQSEEEIKKRLEERRLVEESDMAIAKTLFGNEENDSELEIEKNQKPIQFEKPKKLVSKQYENELKQKELAKIIREKKAAEAKHIELYGEYVEDEYSHYEDKFNN
jgi:hypothetical protein